jgi:hypothetical protein
MIWIQQTTLLVCFPISSPLRRSAVSVRSVIVDVPILRHTQPTQPTQPTQHIQPIQFPIRPQSPDTYHNPSEVSENDAGPLPLNPHQPAVPPQHHPTQRQYPSIQRIQVNLNLGSTLNAPLPRLPRGRFGSGTTNAPLPPPPKSRDVSGWDGAPLVQDKRPSSRNPTPTNTYSPGRSPHHSGSPPKSSSSANEIVPQESGEGYDALSSDNNMDAARKDPNRATIKPNSYKTTQEVFQLPWQPRFSPGLVGGTHAETPPLRIKRHSQPPLSWPLLSENSGLPYILDNFTIPTRHTPQTAFSDAAQECEQKLGNSESKLEPADKRWRAQKQEAEEEQQRTYERDREREREAQRRPQPKSRGTGASEHWTVVPSHIPHSDYLRERPALRYGSRPPPPRRDQSLSEYSPRSAPSEGGSSRRTADKHTPANWAVSWIPYRPPPFTYRRNQSMEDLRATTARHPTPLQPLPMTQPPTSGTTPVPPTPNFDDRAIVTGFTRGFGNSVLCEPPSPATPPASSYSASLEPSRGDITGPPDVGSAELATKRYPWMGGFAGDSPLVPQSVSLEYPLTRRLPKSLNSFNTHPNNQISVSDEDFRQLAEDVHKRSKNLFPEHDFDEPVIEASSNETSLTSAEVPQQVIAPDRRKDKESIRVVTNERRREPDRSSVIIPPRNANVLGKRNTKPLGTRMEEGTAEQVEGATPALSPPAEPPSGPRRAFRRGKYESFTLTIMQQRSSHGSEESSSAGADMARCTSR